MCSLFSFITGSHFLSGCQFVSAPGLAAPAGSMVLGFNEAGRKCGLTGVVPAKLVACLCLCKAVVICQGGFNARTNVDKVQEVSIH